MGILYSFGQRTSVRTTQILKIFICSSWFVLLLSANWSGMALTSVLNLSSYPSVLDIVIMQEHCVSVKITVTALTKNSKMYLVWMSLIVRRHPQVMDDSETQDSFT